jgi:hypothetical protein
MTLNVIKDFLTIILSVAAIMAYIIVPIVIYLNLKRDSKEHSEKLCKIESMLTTKTGDKLYIDKTECKEHRMLLKKNFRNMRMLSRK